MPCVFCHGVALSNRSGGPVWTYHLPLGQNSSRSYCLCSTAQTYFGGRDAQGASLVSESTHSKEQRLLFTVAQIIIARHNNRAGEPLVNHTGLSQSGGSRSSKFLVFAPGVPQIRQLHEIIRRALRLRWIWGLISMEFHGQSTPRENSLVFSRPKQIASTFNLGENPHIYDPESLHLKTALTAMRNLWQANRVVDNVRSCIICTNVAESGVTIPDVGLVVSSGFHSRVSMDVRTGATVNALQTFSKSAMTQQTGRSGRIDEGDHITMMSHSQLVEQVPAQDIVQPDESDLSPMILPSLVSGQSLERLPFLWPPDRLVSTKQRMSFMESHETATPFDGPHEIYENEKFKVQPSQDQQATEQHALLQTGLEKPVRSHGCSPHRYLHGLALQRTQDRLTECAHDMRKRKKLDLRKGIFGIATATLCLPHQLKKVEREEEKADHSMKGVYGLQQRTKQRLGSLRRVR